MLASIDSQSKEDERFSQVLVRLGVLPERSLPLALKLAWDEEKGLDTGEGGHLFDLAALGLAEAGDGQHLNEKTAEMLKTPPLPPAGQNDEAKPIFAVAPVSDPNLRAIFESTKHIRLTDDTLGWSQSSEAPGAEEPDEPAWPERGMKLDHLHLLRRLDEGGSAEVWKAWHENLHIHIAVKFLKRDLCVEQYAEKFFGEARSIASLNHSNIVRVYNCSKRKGFLYIEEEYVKGASLSVLRKMADTISVQSVAEAGICVAMGLAHAWRRGLMHRDVKPANVMVTIDGEIKLTDFGLAQSVLGPLEESPTELNGGFLAGTPAYMAPELIMRGGGPLSAQTDMYALGGSLFSLCAGRLPFKANTVAQMFYEHLNAPPPKLADLVPGAEHLSPVVDRLLKKKPSERYMSYNEVVADLFNCLNYSNPAASQASQWGEPVVSEELGQLCRVLT